MFHFLYKTYTNSGKYYVGRHSTKNVDDGYLGSGKWVKGIKDKTILKREILKFVDTVEELKREEKFLLEGVIDDPLNMNFNNSAEGFAVGNLNPAHSEQERKRRRDHNWMKTEEARRWVSENNPSKKDYVKEKRREQAARQFREGTHNFQIMKQKAAFKPIGKL